MKNILIVGGSSSVGRALINKLSKDKINRIISTYNKKCDKNLFTNSAVLQIELDLTSSLSNFWTDHNNHIFDHAIFLSSILLGKPISDYNNNEIDNVMQINFSGQAKLIKYLIPKMNNKSQFIFVSSISAQKGSFDPIYAASKAALIGFGKSLAASLAPKIRTNTICPALIEDSTMFNTMTKELQEKHRDETPTKTLLKIDDLASIIYDLTQDHWAHLNGATIDLNGGRYVR